MSSLFGNSGALINCLNWNVSDSTSSVTEVMEEILSQCRCFMALWAIISRSGQHSLKSSIVFLRSRKACHSFKALGSFRILKRMAEAISLGISILLMPVMTVKTRLTIIPNWQTENAQLKIKLVILPRKVSLGKSSSGKKQVDSGRQALTNSNQPKFIK